MRPGCKSRPKGPKTINDHNPPRIAPRHLLDLGVGTDNLYSSGDGKRITLRFTVSNLTNKVALYNFLSTFSGTHFVEPRSYSGTIGFHFLNCDQEKRRRPIYKDHGGAEKLWHACCAAKKLPMFKKRVEIISRTQHEATIFVTIA